MTAYDAIVIGATGFIGSSIVREAESRGLRILGVNRANYDEARGASCRLLINANGNSKKFVARNDPPEDFRLSVQSAVNILHDFSFERMVYLSTIDVYSDRHDPDHNHEEAVINVDALDPYGFNKWVAEQAVRHYAPDALCSSRLPLSVPRHPYLCIDAVRA